MWEKTRCTFGEWSLDSGPGANNEPCAILWEAGWGASEWPATLHSTGVMWDGHGLQHVGCPWCDWRVGQISPCQQSITHSPNTPGAHRMCEDRSDGECQSLDESEVSQACTAPGPCFHAICLYYLHLFCASAPSAMHQACMWRSPRTPDCHPFPAFTRERPCTTQTSPGIPSKPPEPRVCWPGWVHLEKVCRLALIGQSVVKVVHRVVFAALGRV